MLQHFPKKDTVIAQYFNVVKKKGFNISKTAISRVLNAKGKSRNSEKEHSIYSRSKHPQPMRTAAVMQIVKSLVKVENPATQRSIASRTGTSQAMVHRIIKENLELENISKSFVHKLYPLHNSERKTNARKLYEKYLAADKWKFVVTLDEAWLYLSDTNKIRAIYYRQKGEKSYTKWLC